MIIDCFFFFALLLQSLPFDFLFLFFLLFFPIDLASSTSTEEDDAPFFDDKSASLGSADATTLLKNSHPTSCSKLHTIIRTQT